MDYFIGIDVSKNTLEVAVLYNGQFILEEQIENEPLPVRTFLKKLMTFFQATPDQLVVCMEHTGIYNTIALEVFWKKRIRICLEPALRIKQSQGMQRGKNDKVDARRIATYAFKNSPELTFWKPQREIIQEMQVLLSLRQRLIKAKVQLEVPLKEAIGFIEPAVQKKMVITTRKALRGINADLDDVYRQLDVLIKKDPSLQRQVDQITSVPGVGRVTALHMISTTQEFTRITEAKKFACYAGVAPFEHSSGTSIHGRTRVSRLANMTMKTLLHMAAMSAIQCSPEIKAFYQRKVAAGKNKMSVINAVRNKLISRVFACVNNNRTFIKNYQFALA